MEAEEYFEFQELKKFINITDKSLFKDYIKEVFKEKNVPFSEDFFFTFFSARDGIMNL